MIPFGHGAIVIGCSWIHGDYSQIKIIWLFFEQPIPRSVDAFLAFSGVANAHERLDLEPVLLGNTEHSRIVFQGGSLVDISKDSRMSRFKATKQPPESGCVHRFGL